MLTSRDKPMKVLAIYAAVQPYVKNIFAVKVYQNIHFNIFLVKLELLEIGSNPVKVI
jgi:hypothetical protein